MSSTYAPIPVGIDALLITLASIAIILRLVSRKLSDAGLWWDDWCALAAFPFSVVISASFLAAGFHGFGNHGGDPTFFLHVLYFDEIWYMTGIALTKVSVLFFYRRIFAVTRPLKMTLWAVGILVLLWYISFTMAAILQCVPVDAYWNPKIKAKCVQKYPFFLGQAVPNIFVDFVLLVLPIQPLWKLQLKRAQRIALVGLFLLGYLNPVVSVIRIVSFIQLGAKTGEDINYGFVPPALWSAAEVAIAILSCSIPGMTHLFNRLFGITKLISAKGSGKGYKGSKNTGRSYELGASTSGNASRMEAGQAGQAHDADNTWLVSAHAASKTSSRDGSDTYEEAKEPESEIGGGGPRIHVKRDVNLQYA